MVVSTVHPTGGSGLMDKMPLGTWRTILVVCMPTPCAFLWPWGILMEVWK